MTGLLRSELQRFSSRRLFRWIGIALLAAILAAGIINVVTSSRDPEAARRRAAVDVANCERERERMLDRERGGEGHEGIVEIFECPDIDDITPFYDEAFRYAQTISDATRFVSTLLLVAAFMVGASFAGAEWGSGSMSTFLTWEPRRIRVLAAKATTAGAILTVAVMCVLAFLALVHLPAGYLRGYMEGVDTAYWGRILPIWARSGVLAGMFAMAGVGVAMAVRHTAAAIVLGGAYAAILDPVLAVAREGRLRPWLLFHNVPRFQGYEVQTEFERDPFGGTSASFAVLPIWRSALLLSLYVLAILTVSYVVFERRDVT